jgi:hypothetical protein
MNYLYPTSALIESSRETRAGFGRCHRHAPGDNRP